MNPPNPVADILGALATDPNIDPHIAAAFKKAQPRRFTGAAITGFGPLLSSDPAWVEYRREEERAFGCPDGGDE